MWPTLVGLLIIALTVLAIVRRAEVRLTLLLSGLALGCVAGQPHVIIQSFFSNFSSEQFLLPLGSSLGFAYVLRQTCCDQHLVRLLVRPVEHVRPLMIPGMVLVGTAVNVPIVSQMSTAVLVGSVLVPLMRAVGISPITTGSALLLGASIGGEFFNPGSPELGSVARATGVPSTMECVTKTVPLLMVQLVVSTALFWVISLRAEARYAWPKLESGEPPVPVDRVNLVKAVVPLVPLVLLFMTAMPNARLFEVPTEWLVNVKEASSDKAVQASFNARLIGAAMLIGSTLATLVDMVSGALAGTWRSPGNSAKAFFEGVGYSLTHVVSIILCANSFGKGVVVSGLADLVRGIITGAPGLLVPSAAVLPLGFAWLCGSGMASTQSLIEFYVAPARDLQVDPVVVGAVVSIASSAGRTLSPVAAVVLFSSSVTATDPLALIRRLAIPLLAGTTAVVLAVMLFH